MTELDKFAKVVREIYQFLVRDYDFQLVIPEWNSGLESIVFKGAAYDIEIGWYKGEIDILFRVTLENAVFRPHISRQFSLSEMLLAIDDEAWNDPPELPRWVVSSEDAAAVLRYYAKLMKKHCAGVLKGDLAVFETLTAKRRDKG
ncbi:MAG: hypothetical protein HY914_19260 [Desulfomonile tiedjei]|nr:hypothetical protein [Desulfomonile tiedjei]